MLIRDFHICCFAKYYDIMYFGKDLEEENCTFFFFFNEFLLSLKIVTFKPHWSGWKKVTFLQLFCSQVFAIMVTEVKVLIKGSAGRWHVQNRNRKVAAIQPLGHLLWQRSLAGDRTAGEGTSQLCSTAFPCFSSSTPYVSLLFLL